MKYVCDFKRRNWNQEPTTSKQRKLNANAMYFHVLSCLSYLDGKLTGEGGDSVPYYILSASKAYAS